MDRFDAAVARWDVTRFLRQQTSDTPDFTETGQVHVVCPRCGGTKRRLYVNMKNKLWICHKCNRKGNALGLVMLFTRHSVVEAMKLILTASPARDGDEASDGHVPKPVVKATMHKLYHPLTMPETEKSKPFWDYIIGRGLSPTLAMEYKLGYIRTGTERNRLVIPIYQGGELAGYTARALHETSMKYWTEAWCHTSQLLFNLDRAALQDEVVLVEGQFDALRLPDRMVASFGKKLSAAQIDLLTRAGVRKIVVCYDADAAADGKHFAERLPEFMEVRKATLPPGHDPGDAPMRALLDCIRDAKPM